MLATTFLVTCSLMPLRHFTHGGGSFTFDMDAGPYVGGTSIQIKTRGITGAAPLFSVLGPGAIEHSNYTVPITQGTTNATLIGATENAIALQEIQIAPPPQSHTPLVAVATYYSGIVLHSASDFHIVGIVPIDGAAGDVAAAGNGDLYVPATDSNALFNVSRIPWQVQRIDNVPLGNEAVVDAVDGAVFVSNRDINGKGALTRIRGSSVDRVITGATAEGLALDSAHHAIYVGNVNDGTVAQIDTRTLHVLRRIPAVPRVFGIALDPARRRLFAVSNQNVGMAGGGYVAALDLGSAPGKVIARSAKFPFPLGIAFDARRNLLFVTDEDAAEVYVLDARTLHARHAPLQACAVPWRPHLDVARRRLFVPCARSNRVAVFDLDRLRQIRGSPFATGRYPLGVATSA